MTREERAGSTDTFVSDDSEDPLTCPLTQRLFHDPVILVASGVTYEASALEECLRRAPDMDPKTGERFELPAVTAPNLVARSLAARRRKKKNKPAASLEAGYRGLPTGPHHDRYKTRICKYGPRCPYLRTGDCQYLHPEEEEYAATQGVPSPPRSPPAQNVARSYKTKICRFGDRCPYLVTNKCQFAHSVDELEYWKRVRLDSMVEGRHPVDELSYGAPPPPSMPRRASSLNAVDWQPEPQIDPFTAAPVAPRQASTSSSDPFGDPWGRLLAKESQSSLANSTGNLSAPAAYGEPSPSLSNRSMYGEPAGLGLSAASLPYDGSSPYA